MERDMKTTRQLLRVTYSEDTSFRLVIRRKPLPAQLSALSLKILKRGPGQQNKDEGR